MTRYLYPYYIDTTSNPGPSGVPIPMNTANPRTLGPCCGTTLTERILGIPHLGLSRVFAWPSFNIFNVAYIVAGAELTCFVASKGFVAFLPRTNPFRRWLSRSGYTLGGFTPFIERTVLFGTIMAVESLCKYRERLFHETPAKLGSPNDFPYHSMCWLILAAVYSWWRLATSARAVAQTRDEIGIRLRDLQLPSRAIRPH
ncbi:hypothetical protein B0T25DRAFT_129841 [Lasiosphaeria hispida]|uniref:Uncharacterized protein n=1 Tax=Lasiosphaeria hispida TaxID=260671 RepID=A0AAJ0HS21_9PEZI|nr:hypothetical protein B0T25DRAFT_129841 [Lasiosphaeria hispida]